MSVAFQVVPWYNIQEWQQVYDKIYAQPSLATKQEALNHLLVWKARCPSLLSGIESTLTLLEVHVQDLTNNTEICSDHLLRLAYSSALMRFVNHMLDTDTAKGLTLFQAAKNSGIPDWIIELRHDTAHSDRLPPLDLLREATLTSLEWLQKSYWDKHKENIDNLVVGKLQDNSDIEDKISALINFCISLSICSHPKCNIKHVSDITDCTLRESLINDAGDLFDNGIDFTNLRLVSINYLIETMNSKCKKLARNELASTFVNKVLLADDSLFLSIELHSLLDNYNSDCIKCLCKQYVQCFEVLLNFLHSNDLLLNFVLELITLTHTKNDRKGRLGAQWVSIILKAWKRNQIFMEKLYESDIQDLSVKDKKDLYSLFYHWFPNKKKSLLIDLRKPVPKNITDIKFIQPIISTYNPNLTYFIQDLLDLVQPRLPKSAINKICRLAKIITSPEVFPVVSSKIYTVEDIKTKDVSDVSNTVNENEVLEINTKEIENTIAETGHQKFGIWQISTGSHAWSTCPIGQLPWQLSKQVQAMDI
ncbi:unnamed protein product [Euphydryas editha]|uniref:Uncharacterized protein n=1 Tax=Euphydryas editha TaxID=104508 RepID=A0AAU9TJL8_EUPED|nr:unnamed protein product [Euphydryas editha]